MCKKNNETSFSYEDREIPTLGSTENAGNSVNPVSGIISLPSGWDSRSASETDELLIILIASCTSGE